MAIFSAISTFFGGITGFLDVVQRVLNIHPTIFQFISFVLFVSGAIGLVTVALLIARRPKKEEDLLVSRCDTFEARTDKKQYEIGQVVFFIVDFKGKLKAGFYDTMLVRPDDKEEWVWDPKTFRYAPHLQTGELRGEYDHHGWRWGWPILIDRPPGEYTAHIGVYDSYKHPWAVQARIRLRTNWLLRRVWRRLLKTAESQLAVPIYPPIAQKTVRFTVVKRLTVIQEWIQSVT